jgi:hypothetical protein
MFELVTTLYMDGHASPYPPKLPLPTIEPKYHHILKSPPTHAAVLRHRSSALSQLTSRSQGICSEKFPASETFEESLSIKSAEDVEQTFSYECAEIVTEEASVQEIIIDSKGSLQRLVSISQNTDKAARVLGMYGVPMEARALSVADRRRKGKRSFSKISPKMA